MPPFNGTGVYSLPAGNPVTTGTSVSSTVQNNTLSDIATALTDCVTKDGQSSPTANIPMATFRFTNVGAGVALTDLATLGQAQSDASKWLSGVTGTDTITATVSPVPSAYAAGMSFRFVPAGTNTTTSVTLNISSLGAKAITKNGSTPLAVGDIPAGVAILLIYDGTQFQMLSTTTCLSLGGGNMAGGINFNRTTVASTTTPDIWTSTANNINYTGTVTATGFAAAPQAGAERLLDCAGAAVFTAGANMLIDGVTGGSNLTVSAGDRVRVFARTTTQFVLSLVSGLMTQTQGDARYAPISVFTYNNLTGCTMSTAGASATMSIAAGKCTDSTNAVIMVLSAIAKTTSSWAVGTAAGGLDTGTIANSTWYHFYVIRNASSGLVDLVFSANATSPTLPSGYTQYRRIGSAKTNGSAQWTKFFQDGDLFTWDIPVNDVNVTNPGTAAVTRTLTTPLGVRVEAKLAVHSSVGGSGTYLLITDLALTDTTPSATIFTTYHQFANSAIDLEVNKYTNTSSQIRTRHAVSDASVGMQLITLGWKDTRGRDA